MRNISRHALAMSLLCLLPVGSAAADTVVATTAPVKRVVLVMFENTKYADAVKQPFFARLGKEGALMTNFFAEGHPSQPNYIALTSGDTHGVINDSNVNVDARHIGDLLEAKGKTWRAYAEEWPGNCYSGAKSGKYVRKHVPFISYKDVQSSPTRCANIVDASRLVADIDAGTLPDFIYYAPNLNDDGHDTDVQSADTWFSTTFGPLLNDPRFTDGLLFIATFDEDDRTSGNHIYTAFWGPTVRPGVSLSGKYDHYSLLRTIEDALQIGNLGARDATATAITGWQ